MLIVIEKEMTGTQQLELARKLIGAQAFFVCAWGLQCERMHDVVDDVCVEQEVLEKRCADDVPVVMTTWHSKENLEEAFWFFRELAEHPDVPITSALIFHVADVDKCQELIALHNAVSVEDLR